ncbi:MAG: helix-turn-helix domain-containing protein [Blastocatellia bacterium]|nr:helix-turn-helix domain-containing protein [Blastocatellia bacterium]MCS7158395.1 helix-turn-helix domain-containing protein [Blastocatellia bacterium]MCX7752901.1 helix-turn-helix domain-containing protein [Blastocatellia bacterium]MDW8167957.1 helix-turn-helix domain-containing protein [Acidobacteriota bacterium]MDW8255982.1 helix-turn-helix domain-containing protein [Acidobacteriota bacterium]
MAVPKVVFTLKEVAEYLNVHPDTVRRYVKRGELPAFKIGTDWRFNKESIDRWRKAQEERCRRALHTKRRSPKRGSQSSKKRPTNAQQT